MAAAGGPWASRGCSALLKAEAPWLRVGNFARGLGERGEPAGSPRSLSRAPGGRPRGDFRSAIGGHRGAAPVAAVGRFAGTLSFWQRASRHADPPQGRRHPEEQEAGREAHPRARLRPPCHPRAPPDRHRHHRQQGRPGSRPFRMMPGVADAVPVSQPFKLVSREVKPDDTFVEGRRRRARRRRRSASSPARARWRAREQDRRHGRRR